MKKNQLGSRFRRDHLSGIIVLKSAISQIAGLMLKV